MPSEKMHRLLKRQIKRAFGDSFAIPEEWRDFIALVNSAYHESDMDRDMLERSLDLSSQELMQANSGMWAIFEAVPDLFFRVDASGRILDCKAGSHTPDLFISRTNMIGRRIDDIPVASVARKFRQAIEDVRETKSPVSIEYSLKRHQTELFYEARWIPLEGDQTVIVIRNVTDRKDVENALKKSEEILTKLINAIPDIIVRTDLEGNIIFINDYALKFSHYSRDEVIGRNMLEFIAPQHQERVFQNALLMQERKLSPQEYALIFKDGKEIPFEVNGDVLHNEDGTPFGLVNVCRDITDRKNAENTLKKSEEYYRELTTNSSDVLFIVDARGDILYASPSIEWITGYNPDELIGKNSLYLIAPDDHARALEEFRWSLKTRDVSIPNSFRIRHKNGSELIMEGVGKNLLHHPVIAGFVINVRDVTERRQAEEALRESEKKYRLLTEKMSDIVWIADLNLNTVYISPSVFRALGFTQDEIPRTVAQQMTPESMTVASQTFLAELAVEKQGSADSDRVVNLLLEYYHKDGSTRWMDTTISGLRDDQGNLTGLHGVSRDITEKKKAEDALRESEKKYRLLSERISDVVWIADMNLQESYVSPSIQKVLGFSPEERLIQTIDQQLTAESLSFALETMARELDLEKQGTADPDRNVTLALEYYHKDGTTRWMEAVITGIRNDQGILNEIYGVARDITENKQAQEKLQESENKLKAIFDQIDTGIMIIDSETQHIMEANRKAIEMTGLSRERIIGQICHSLVCPAEKNKCPIKDLGQNIDQSERILLCADGSRTDILKTVNPITIQGRKCFLESFIDISDRKRAQDALRAAHAELEHRVVERTAELTAANHHLQELFQKQEINIDLAKNVLAFINHPPSRHNLIRDKVDLFCTAFYLPCYAEGGDHYFVKSIPHQNNGARKTTVSLKDQSGHEVSCILRSIVTDMIHNDLLINTRNASLEETIARLNHGICELPFFGGDNFFTAVNAEIHHKDLKMKYLSAGHPPFLLIREEEVFCLPSLDGQGRNLPVGVSTGVEYSGGEIHLQPGDKMIFYTDGLTDIPHKFGKPVLNADKLKNMVSAIIQSRPRLPVSVVMAKLFEQISGYKSNGRAASRIFDDDITLLGLELESRKEDAEDIVRAHSLDDLDQWVNRLFHRISEEWKQNGFSSPETRLRPVLAEVMANAWKHGNHRDPKKAITVRRRYGNDAVLEVIDEGNGFDFTKVYDPTRKDNLLKPRGRGHFIIRLHTDETQWQDNGRKSLCFFSREGQSKNHFAFLPG